MRRMHTIRHLALCLATSGLLAGCGLAPRGVVQGGQTFGWGGCFYRLGTKIPARDLGEKLGSPESFAMDSVAYDVYTAHIPGDRRADLLAFVVGGSAYEGIRADQMYSAGDAIPQAAMALENYVSGATFPMRPGTMQGRVAVGASTPLRTIPAILQTRAQILPPYCSDTFRVTFIERWKAKDIRSAYSGASTLAHYWILKATPDFTKFLSQGGTLPPQEGHKT